MTQDDARQLIADALTAYRNHHKHFPARVIVLKTSQFREEEADGIFEALDKAGAELRDLVWVQELYSVKVFRDGNYPVMRGTFVELDRKGLLYTNGRFPYYGTYPGIYDPRPLLLCPYPGSDSTLRRSRVKFCHLRRSIGTLLKLTKSCRSLSGPRGRLARY